MKHRLSFKSFGLYLHSAFNNSSVHNADRKREKALSQANPACSNSIIVKHIWLNRTHRYRSMRQQWHDIELVGVGLELTLEYDHIKYTANPQEISSPSFITKAVGRIAHCCPSNALPSVHLPCHLDSSSDSLALSMLWISKHFHSLLHFMHSQRPRTSHVYHF